MRSAVAFVLVVAFALIGIGHGYGCGGGDYVPVLRTTVKWEFNRDLTRGFDGDGCIDLGVRTVRVAIAGPTTDTQDVSCSERQAVFIELDAGTYNVTVTPLDANGVSMVSAPSTGSITVSSQATELVVEVPYTAWLQAYTGTFMFKLMWNGQPCAMALPPAVTQVLTLLIGGDPVSQVTDTGQELDGTDPQPCRPSTDQFPQMVLDLPLGPATIVVEGRNGAGTTMYNKQYDTFVGAGTSNPTYVFDTPGPDAAPAPDAL